MSPPPADDHARTRAELLERLRGHVSPLDARLRARVLGVLTDRVAAELTTSQASPSALALALLRAAESSAGALARLDEHAAVLFVAYQNAVSEAERREVLTRYLTATVRDPLRLAADIAATRRWLDLEAIQDRMGTESSDRADEIELAYRIVQQLAAGREPLTSTTVQLAVPMALAHANQARIEGVRTAALGAVAALLRRLDPTDRPRTLGVPALRQLSQWAAGQRAERWLQAAALEVCVVALPDDALRLITERLRDRGARDGLITRSAALRLLRDLRASKRERVATALVAHDDPSEHVRQQLARTLAALNGPDAIAALAELALGDSSPRVAGLALRQLGELAQHHPAARDPIQHVLVQVFTAAPHALLLKLGFEAVQKLSAGNPPAIAPEHFVPALSALVQRTDVNPELIQLGALLLRELEINSDAQLQLVRARVEDALRQLGEGESKTLELDPELRLGSLERVLVVAARGDMGVWLRVVRPGRYVLTRGEPRRTRAWRVLHELKNPAPDKRKGFSHSSGRTPAGHIFVPPQGMAEVTPTRVPGERRHYRALGGWGSFLPRVDELLAATRLWASPVRLVTSLGTITVRGPVGSLARLKAWFELTTRYAHYAKERERALESKEPHERKRFVELVQQLGFAIELGDTEGQIAGQNYSVRVALATRYLALALPLSLPYWAEDGLSQMLSPHSNTAWHLAIVAWLVFSLFTVRSAWVLHRVEHFRGRVPLTIGGWGTRGKSGSERLKAGLLHALRYDVVVKTTGCEAMFIHARRDRPAREIFLYRPYDKATIWEQKNVLESAARLHAQVFLWECMALQPPFVNLLAREWMKDEITTLTNAYPDHEDVMGPAGEDVARVIGLFMPFRGTTFTTEEQMLPLIQDAARKAQTRLVVIPPVEAELLPADLLARFPYDEHPLNIALITNLAEHLGIERERALIAMADAVVPDLGVLKTYPEVEHAGRRLVFSNGMSANERAGFMSNWIRLEFDKHDQDEHPDTVTVTIVNNRADRVPRSRVFAEIMVRDIGVNHIILIGTNLGGLNQFIEEALDVYLNELSVAGEGGTPRALERYDAALRRLKIPLRPGALTEDIARLLSALALTPEQRHAILTAPPVAAALDTASPELADALHAALAPHAASLDAQLLQEVLHHAARLARHQHDSRATRDQIRAAVDAGRTEEADTLLRQLYRRLFLERVATVERADTVGDAVIDFLTRQIPPGFRGRLMGCQNIKGTGLDFVYRWLSVGAVRTALDRLRDDPAARAETLSWLMSYADFGLLDCRDALRFLDPIRQNAPTDWTEHQPLVNAVFDRLRQVEAERLKKMTSTRKKTLFELALDKLEPYVDHWDSIRRRRLATRVMNDLFEVRIGQGRAALLLRDLVAREKGGWLAKDIARYRERRARHRSSRPRAA